MSLWVFFFALVRHKTDDRFFGETYAAFSCSKKSEAHQILNFDDHLRSKCGLGVVGTLLEEKTLGLMMEKRSQPDWTAGEPWWYLEFVQLILRCIQGRMSLDHWPITLGFDLDE